MDGALAASTKDGEMSAATVIIQYTTVGTSRFTEYGSRPRYAKTTGITGVPDPIPANVYGQRSAREG